jgi:tetratricopeptide (TPR) repeat protein
MPYLALIALVAVYSVGTLKRNKVWSSEEALWMDSAVKSPNKDRPQMNLGKIYLDMYRKGAPLEYLKKAEQHLTKAIELKSNKDSFHNLGLVYQEMAEKGIAPNENLIKARENYLKAIKLTTKIVEEAETKKKKEAKYDEHLRNALETQIKFFREATANIYHDLAISYEFNDEGKRYGEGFNLIEAVSAWDNSLKYESDVLKRMLNRAVAIGNSGDKERGDRELESCMLKAGERTLAGLFYKIGFDELANGNGRDARYCLETAIKLDPNDYRYQKAIESLKTFGK